MRSSGIPVDPAQVNLIALKQRLHARLVYRTMRVVPVILFISGLFGRTSAQAPFALQISLPDTTVGIYPKLAEKVGEDAYSISGAIRGNGRIVLFEATVDVEGMVQDQFLHALDTAMGNTAPPVPPLRCSDGGLLFLNEASQNDTYYFHLLKTDAAGQVQWNKYYTDSLGTQFTGMRHALVEKDGSYFVFGGYHNVPVNTGWDNFLLRVDANGDVEQVRLFGDQAQASDVPRTLIRTNDNGLITAEILHPYASMSVYHGISVQRWDSSLDLLWSKQYDLGYTHFFHTATELADGGIVLVGARSMMNVGPYLPFLCKLDGAGDVQWTRAALDDQLVWESVLERNDGSLVVRGWKWDGVETRPVIGQLNADGGLMSALILNAAQPAFSAAQLVPVPGDSEFLLVGDTRSTLFHDRGVLVSLDGQLQAACGANAISWADTLLSAQVYDRPVVVSSVSLSSVDAGSEPLVWPFSAQDICLSTPVPDLAPENSIIVSPVPARDVLQLALPQGRAMQAGPFDVVLTNGLGEVVLHQREASSAQLRVDVSGLPAGAYIASIHTPSGRWVGKALVE